MLTSSREGTQEEEEAEGSWRVRLVEFRRKEEGKGQEEMSGWCYGHFGACHCFQQPTSRERAITSLNRRSLPLGLYNNFGTDWNFAAELSPRNTHNRCLNPIQATLGWSRKERLQRFTTYYIFATLDQRISFSLSNTQEFLRLLFFFCLGVQKLHQRRRS